MNVVSRLSTADRCSDLLSQAARHLTCALQPIVDANTGSVHAVEALLRGFDRLGYANPLDLLDDFAGMGAISALEVLLHQRAIEAFVGSGLRQDNEGVKLFLNVDGRALVETSGLALERTLEVLLATGLPASALCWELSERHALITAPEIDHSMRALRERGVRFAADDFGQGHSEMKLLFDHCVDYVKVDKYFISGIAESERRKLFLSNICGFAHVLGMRVVAEGVETLQEFLVCREIGCDLIQGWFVARPQLHPQMVRSDYPHIREAVSHDRRVRSAQPHEGTARDAMEIVPHVHEDMRVDDVLVAFRDNPRVNACVVVDAGGEPRGVITEAALRPFLYTQYGRSLLGDETVSRPLHALISPCPIVDAARTVTEVLAAFFAQKGAEGVIVTEGGRYAGMLCAPALLTVANDRRTEEAMDRNPLTRLPGNKLVSDRIADLALAGTRDDGRWSICVFDFDYFKAFNDVKGFRQGDRVIVLFAEAMRRYFPEKPGLLFGHIGGDDFVLLVEDMASDHLRERLGRVLEEFGDTVAGLYTEIERQQGWVDAKDRYGTVRRPPLLRCSVAVLEMAPGAWPVDPRRIDERIVSLKAEAKASVLGIAWERIAAERLAESANA